MTRSAGYGGIVGDVGSACTICGELPARVDADLEADESLPAAASTLEAIADGNLRRCPACGAYFLYTYDYEYGAMGDGWETATLERVDKQRVIELLLDSAPTDAVVAALAQLDVLDAGTAIEKRLLDALDVPAESHNALLQLMTVFWARNDMPAIERLLQHPRPEVRSHALYALHTPGSGSWFRAARAATDPNPEVRARAVAAALSTPHQPTDPISRAVIACLDDPESEVRGNAAWTLAVWAEAKRDIGAALPALTRLAASDPSDKVRTTVKRALVGAGVTVAASESSPEAPLVTASANDPPVAVARPAERVRLVSTQVIGAHADFPREPAFSPDGSRFVTGDQAGWLVVRARRADDPTHFEEVARVQTPSGPHSRPDVHSIAFPTNELVVSSEWGALRVRRASDLQEVAVAENLGKDVASGGGGTWLGVLSEGTVRVLEMPSLKRRSISAFCRGDFEYFKVGPFAVDPQGTLFAVADDGGSDETVMAQRLRSGEPQITIVDSSKKATRVAVIEQGNLTCTLVFDPWRSRIITAMYAGDVGLWSYDGRLEQRFRPYGNTTVRVVVPTKHWLLMMPDGSMGNFFLDVWDPVSLERVASVALPKECRPQWIHASPDGRTLLTFEYVPGGTFAIRIWAIEG